MVFTTPHGAALAGESRRSHFLLAAVLRRIAPAAELPGRRATAIAENSPSRPADFPSPAVEAARHPLTKTRAPPTRKRARPHPNPAGDMVGFVKFNQISKKVLVRWTPSKEHVLNVGGPGGGPLLLGSNWTCEIPTYIQMHPHFTESGAAVNAPEVEGYADDGFVGAVLCLLPPPPARLPPTSRRPPSNRRPPALQPPPSPATVHNVEAFDYYEDGFVRVLWADSYMDVSSLKAARVQGNWLDIDEFEKFKNDIKGAAQRLPTLAGRAPQGRAPPPPVPPPDTVWGQKFQNMHQEAQARVLQAQAEALQARQELEAFKKRAQAELAAAKRRAARARLLAATAASANARRAARAWSSDGSPQP